MLLTLLYQRRAAVILPFMVVLLLFPALRPLEGGQNYSNATVAVFPFNNVNHHKIDLRIPSVLKSELARKGKIKVLPLEVVEKRIYDLEPEFMWTGRKGIEERGGIVWNITPELILRVSSGLDTDYSIYGDITGFGKKKRIDAYVLERQDESSGESFTVEGESMNELAGELNRLADMLRAWIEKDFSVEKAEMDVQRYMAGLSTYAGVIGNLKGYISEFPDTLPLRALLVDMYMKRKGAYEDSIISEGLGLIHVYSPAVDEDTRYLLSLDLDPFDAVADIYESREKWEKAIEIRNRARDVFPYKESRHRMQAGTDHYFLARKLERGGQKDMALIHYRKSIELLPETSGHYKDAKERLVQPSTPAP